MWCEGVSLSLYFSIEEKSTIYILDTKKKDPPFPTFIPLAISNNGVYEH